LRARFFPSPSRDRNPPAAMLEHGMIAIGAWESALEDAVHEPDPTMAEAKVRKAEEAILDRIHDCSTSPGSLEEQTLFDALGTIKILRSVRRMPR
jgi:hypothetical protein